MLVEVNVVPAETKVCALINIEGQDEAIVREASLDDGVSGCSKKSKSMIGFGHCFWVDCIGVLEFLHWGPSLFTAREFAMQDKA